MTALSSKKDTPTQVLKLTHFEHLIIRFDVVLSRIQKEFSEDSLVCDLVALARSDIFKLEEAMCGLDVVNFCGLSDEGPPTDDPCQKRVEEAA
jgi:hypothetical protein